MSIYRLVYVTQIFRCFGHETSSSPVCSEIGKFWSKNRCISIVQKLLTSATIHISSEGLITGDETLVYGYDVEPNLTTQKKLPEEPKQKETRQVRSNVNVFLTVFFDYKGVVHRKFLSYGR